MSGAPLDPEEGPAVWDRPVAVAIGMLKALADELETFSASVDPIFGSDGGDYLPSRAIEAADDARAIRRILARGGTGGFAIVPSGTLWSAREHLGRSPAIERIWAERRFFAAGEIEEVDGTPDPSDPPRDLLAAESERVARQVGPVELVVDHYEHEPRTVPTRPVEELRPSVDRRTDPLGLLVGDELAERVEWLVGEAVAYQELADECYLIRATVERSIARAERQIGTLERELREQPSPHQIREALSAPRPAERLEALRALGSSKSEAVRILVADALGTISPDLFRIPGSPEAVPRFRRAILRALDEELRTLVAQSRGAQR